MRQEEADMPDYDVDNSKNSKNNMAPRVTIEPMIRSPPGPLVREGVHALQCNKIILDFFLTCL